MKLIKTLLIFVLIVNSFIAQAQKPYNCRLLEDIAGKVIWERDKMKMIRSINDIIVIEDPETGARQFKSDKGRPQFEIDSLAQALDSFSYVLDSAITAGKKITIVDTIGFFTQCSFTSSDLNLEVVSNIAAHNKRSQSSFWHLISIDSYENSLVLTFSLERDMGYISFYFKLTKNEALLQRVSKYSQSYRE